MTTGDPYSQAEVTNSGTAQDAVLNFVIPRGACCCCDGGGSNEFLTAYSTPPQPGRSGQALVFDRTAASNGSSLTHANNSADITVQKAGFYNVSFHGTLAPASGSTFPLSLALSLQKNGENVLGGIVRHNFQSKDETVCLSFTQIVEINTVPSTLRILAEGGSILYSDIALTVNRLGDL